MNRLALMAVVVAASSAAVLAAETEGNAWPFAILRIYGNGESNDGFLRQVAAAQERHPGLIDEVWLWGGGVFLGTNLYHEAVADNLRWAGELRKRGIGVGFQVGPTLNYSGALDAPRPGFSDEAWVMTDDGVRHPSLFCATSPEAVEENRRVAEVVMAGLKPDSVWPDDDLRNSKRGNRVCFCPRCIALFNAEFGGKWTRETLSAALYGSRPSKEARERWVEFNRRVLGRFARLYREAADKVHPACRLGLQQVGACDTYNGRDYRPILESLSGAGRHSVGMRPGAGYYCDRSPRDMFGKIQWVMLEATRCRGYGFVGQVCYESENWPHVSAEKNPGSQMVENSLALAVGCDSLALYWGTDLNRESDANYAFYLDTFAKWKPFLLAIRDAFKGTRPSGISEFRGADEALNHWCGRWGPVPPRLVENALPLSCEGGDVFAYWLDAERTKDVTSADLPRLLARPVLADVAAFEALARKFPDAAIMKKVRVDSFKELNVASSERQASEVFPGGCKASDFNHVITPLADDVRPFSEVSGRPGACGTCVIPSGYGGALVVCQNLTSEWLWTGPRRKAILDALESVAPGGMSVRLLTGGNSVAVVGRTDSDGRTAGAYVLNPTPGETPPLELALRRPRKGRWFVRTVEGERPAQILRMSPDEVVVRLPPLAAWQPILLAASNGR